MAREVVTGEVVCPRCWLSYTDTVAGSLRSLGVDCDTVDVGGYSGYAFITNVAKSLAGPSGPTALGDSIDRLRIESFARRGTQSEVKIGQIDYRPSN